MVTYGPWIDSHVHRNWILPRRDDGDGDPATALPPEVILGDPLRDAESGWHFGSSTLDDGIALHRATATHATPGLALSAASDAAWVEARAADLVNVLGTSGNAARQSLDVGYSDTVDQSTATWQLYVWSHALRFSAYGAYSGPAPELWPEGAIGIDIEDQGYRELLSMSVLPYSPADAFFVGVYKDAGASDAGWLQSVDTLAGFPEMPTGGTGVNLDATAAQALIDELTTANPSQVEFADPRMPSFALTPIEKAGSGVDLDVSWSPHFELYVEFLGPRYRYIYADEPVEEIIYRPPRRVFPRDDGLTGGARRTWPPSKGYQWGNRVDGSGYL